MAQRVGIGIALLFHDRGTRRRWVVSITSRPHFTPGKTLYPFYRKLGEPQGRSERSENLVLTGIRSRTVQPVVIPYVDWATRPTLSKFLSFLFSPQYCFMPCDEGPFVFHEWWRCILLSEWEAFTMELVSVLACNSQRISYSCHL